ncbi:MAG TPA: uracil-DNA glycosylase [Candidatus Woesebacteria bacterium]|nr:uracil-DNA glycosylase [Candidatus Woesebacteria bacterium]HNS65052.1 uracil-DNA glycosylase [Candidatus Woesebacteria bacterium]
MFEKNRSASLSQIIFDLEKSVDQLPIAEKPTDIVFGEGSPDSEIVLIGEAPGYNEHVQRRPFVGRSGQLLRKTLTQVGFPPEQVYITNIVKARPPDNRDPSPEEILAYKPFLDQEISLIDPKLIITLGRFSMAKFLPDVKISQVHGRLHKVRWNGQIMYVLPMYHPAAALRSTQMLTAFTQDFEKVAKILIWVKEQSELIVDLETISAILL